VRAYGKKYILPISYESTQQLQLLSGFEEAAEQWHVIVNGIMLRKTNTRHEQTANMTKTPC